MAGLTATFIDADSFTVTGDLTATFIPGRRVKADCGVDGIKYGTVVSSSFSTVTQVDLTAASDDLTGNLTQAWFGIIAADNAAQGMPDHSHDGTEGSGGSPTDIVVDSIDTGGFKINTSLEADDILDEDTMVSDSPTALTTQQSQKAFMEAIKDSITTGYAGVNLLDNPAFTVAQQSYPTIPQGTEGFRVGGADRWYADNSGASRFALKQDTVQPDSGDTGYTGIINEDIGVYAMNMSTATATGTVNAGDFGIFGQRIPQSKLLPLILNVSTFSFWARPSLVGTYCAVMRNGGWSAGVPGAGTYDYVMVEFDTTVSNQWQLITVNFPALDVETNPTNWGLGAQSGASPLKGDAGDSLGLELFICMFAGSTYNGGIGDGTWRTGDHLASSNQDNNAVSTGNFRVSQPKLEIGSVRTQFTQPDHSIETAKALRFTERIRASVVDGVYGYGETLTATTSRIFVPFSQKRGIPAIGPLVSAASNFDVRVAGTDYAVSSFDSYLFTKHGVEIVVTHATVGASVNFVASLIDDAAGATFIDIDAHI